MDNSVDINVRDTVLVTGFGPFGVHTINASWEAVKLLRSTGIEEELGIQLVTQEIQVEYRHVTETVPVYWELYKPKLTVHVGVSGATETVQLEQQASNIDYCRLDNNGCCPKGKICIPGGEKCIKSGLDMSLVCQEINNADWGVFSCVSHDPGRYLCEFIYYTSLSICPSQTAFIHVPVLDKPYSAAQLAMALKLAIKAMLRQINGKQNSEMSNPADVRLDRIETVTNNSLIE
nr:EOG090X0F1W [Eulimnadia texana]